jgi:periplasmic divalent cation tolerance protein
LATLLLKEKLAACANLVPKVESHYWWQGQLESSTEVMMIMKTRADALARLEKIVISNHPYDTPEIISLELKEGNEKYLNWISSNTLPRET